LDALGDPTRRAIVERLQEGPRAVGDLASGLPVSRPAVSQHLRVLKEAGLVTERQEGTRRLYRLDPAGLAVLRSYFDRFWETALADFRTAAERREEGMTTQAADLTVRKTVTVAASIERAFEVFTERIAAWWPLASHSLSGDRTQEVVIEGREGGRVYEVVQGGEEGYWATVTAWEPPRRLALSWKVNPRAAAPTEIEVRFTPEGEGTRVDLEHRGFERLGEVAAETSAQYGADSGWETVLGCYGKAANASG
jgi:DNA-binding transcriptional ArsR family regulator